MKGEKQRERVGVLYKVLWGPSFSCFSAPTLAYPAPPFRAGGDENTRARTLAGNECCALSPKRGIVKIESSGKKYNKGNEPQCGGDPNNRQVEFHGRFQAVTPRARTLTSLTSRCILPLYLYAKVRL